MGLLVMQGWRKEWRYGYQESRNPGIQEFRNSGIQESSNSGIQESRNSGIEDFRNSGIQEFSCNFQLFWYLYMFMQFKTSFRILPEIVQNTLIVDHTCIKIDQQCFQNRLNILSLFTSMLECLVD